MEDVMQLINMLTQLAICSLLVLFSTSIVKAEGNPNKPRMRSNSSTPATGFECGVYKGSDQEFLWHYYQYQARMKSLNKSGGVLPGRDFVFDDVAVIEDDGSFLITGINLFDTDMKTFHFTPNANNGYDVANIAFSFDSDFGNNLNLEDDANATADLPFIFTYYGGSWTAIHVNANGIISFGGDINASSGRFNNNDFFSTLPKIAAYFMDLNPEESGDVFFKSESGKVTITWNQIAEFRTNNLNTIQLVLRFDNTFDISFNGVTTKNQTSGAPITFGIHPGGMPNLEAISFSDNIPFTGPAGAGIFETYLNVQNPMVNRFALMNRFYQTYPDSFFQAVFFTNFQQTMRGFANSRTIKTNIQGIGVRIRDGSQAYGSNSILESICNMNQMSVWPIDPEARLPSSGHTFLTIMGQESGHRWGAFVNFVDANGDTSDLIIGRQDAHWSYYFDTDHSVMQGGDWEHVSGNTFTSRTQIDFFSELDEYLMGLRAPEEVTTTFFVSSATNDLLANRSQGPPLMNAFATGTAVEVTIEAIIAAEGPRLPAEADAPKDFRQVFMLVIRNGSTPSQGDLDKIANFRRVWQDYFERSVDGRMTLNTSLTQTFPVAVISGHVLDEADHAIENITVKSSERGFVQFVPGGGRYTFRYLADANSGTGESITIITDAPGYGADTLVTSIAYGTETEVDIVLQAIATFVAETENQVPGSFALEQNYPNPFNPATTIQIKLPVQSEVTLAIYNLNGQLVRTLVQENLPAGNHSFLWDGRNERGSEVASGLYVSRLKAGQFTQHRKMLLMR